LGLLFALSIYGVFMKKILKLMAFIALVVGLTAALSAHANTAHQPLVQSTEKLLKAQSTKFKGMAPAEVAQLQKDFTNKLDVAKNAAKAEFAKLSQDRTPEQFDKFMWERSEKAATPAQAISEIKSMGGPSKALFQIDRVTDEFRADVLAGKQAGLKPTLAHDLLSLLVMAQPAHAKLKSSSCYFMMWVATVGTGYEAAWKLCG
jgi:hypothetical protein